MNLSNCRNIGRIDSLSEEDLIGGIYSRPSVSPQESGRYNGCLGRVFKWFTNLGRTQTEWNCARGKD